MNIEQTFNKPFHKHIVECSEVAYDQIKAQKAFGKSVTEGYDWVELLVETQNQL